MFHSKNSWCTKQIWHLSITLRGIQCSDQTIGAVVLLVLQWWQNNSDTHIKCICMAQDSFWTCLPIIFEEYSVGTKGKLSILRSCCVIRRDGKGNKCFNLSCCQWKKPSHLHFLTALTAYWEFALLCFGHQGGVFQMKLSLGICVPAHRSLRLASSFAFQAKI